MNAYREFFLGTLVNLRGTLNDMRPEGARCSFMRSWPVAALSHDESKFGRSLPCGGTVMAEIRIKRIGHLVTFNLFH